MQKEWAGVLAKEKEQLRKPSFFVPTQDKLKGAGIKDTSRFPVEQVSWNDCQIFLMQINETVKLPESMGKGKFVLPHEDEWEYACRGGKGNKQAYYFGNKLNGEQANCNGKFPYGVGVKAGPFPIRTTEVGSYEKIAPHPWSLCDISGNIWQWCENVYGDKNDARVSRGGSWYDDTWYCRSACRHRSTPDTRNINIGLRVCFYLD